MSLLSVSNLHVEVDDKAILKGLDLAVAPGEVHAVMGPNGSGKSTLANVLAGRPGYQVTDGTVALDDIDLTDAAPEERAHLGLFLAFQYPIEIPGVSNMEFLKAAVDAHAKQAGEDAPSPVEFIKRARSVAGRLQLNADFLKRGVNEGFSGGGKEAQRDSADAAARAAPGGARRNRLRSSTSTPCKSSPTASMRFAAPTMPWCW